MATLTSKIVPHLWFPEDAVTPAKLYVSLLPDSSLDGVTTIPTETPSGPPGTVQVVEFTLARQKFMAIRAGPLDPFTHAISFLVNCEDQAEIDRLWSALSEGGSVEPCGWLKDRWGVSWQITAAAMGKMMHDPDRAKAKRVMDAMLRMKKIVIADLEKAYRG